jgi:predicted transcriptional regulator
MHTIPQTAQDTRREMIMLSMRGGQTGMQSAIAVLIAKGTAGDAEAASLMRVAANHFRAAAVLLDAGTKA